MSEQLKVQTLYDVSEANTKNIIWVDVYVSGTEGSAGVYATRRMTLGQFLTYLNGALTFPVDGSGAVDSMTIWSDSNTTSYSPQLKAYESGGYGVVEVNSATTENKINSSGYALRSKRYGNTPIIEFLRGNGTVASPTNPLAGDDLGMVVFRSQAGHFSKIVVSATENHDGSHSKMAMAFLINNSTYLEILDTGRVKISNAYSLPLADGTNGQVVKTNGAGDLSWASLAISDITSLTSTLSGKEDTSNKNATNGYVGRSAGKIIFQDFDSLFTSFLYNANTAGRTYTFQDRDGVIADGTDLALKAPLNPRVQTVASSATVTPVSTNDLVTITAQAVGLTLANPTGTFVEGQALMIRIKDNGTARTIAFGANYRAIGITTPTTTVISKTMYLGIIYNSTDAKFDIVGLNQEA